jgi:hypothetical protein
MKGNSVMCSPSAGANWSGWILEANRDSGESVQHGAAALRESSGTGGEAAAKQLVVVFPVKVLSCFGRGLGRQIEQPCTLLWLRR